MKPKKPWKQYRAYRSWESMRKRCNEPNHVSYHNYGGRGIKVCDRWQSSFENFFEDMGERPEGNYSIDRRDNDGDYTPENCRWATRKEQQRRTKTNRRVTANGKTQSIAEWAEEFGESYNSFHSRFSRRVNKLGWDEERAILTPPAKRAKVKGKTLKQLSKETDIGYTTLIGRLDRGWDERAITKNPSSERPVLGQPPSKPRKNALPPITYKGKTQSLAAWAKELDIPYGCLRVEVFVRDRKIGDVDKEYKYIDERVRYHRPQLNPQKIKDLG